MNAITKTPAQVLTELKAGNARFLEGTTIQSPDSSLKKLKNFAEKGQLPKAIVLCCSDSRGPAEMIFDQDIGDLFVIRVAGNIVAPSLVGSVEFAIEAFGTNLVLVMGHTQCGAVRAAINQIENPGSKSTDNLNAIVNRIKPHILPLVQINSLSLEEKWSRGVETNVRASVDQLSHSSRLIEDMLNQGKIAIQGAVLELASGKVDFLEM